MVRRTGLVGGSHHKSPSVTRRGTGVGARSGVGTRSAALKPLHSGSVRSIDRRPSRIRPQDGFRTDASFVPREIDTLDGTNITPQISDPVLRNPFRHLQNLRLVVGGLAGVMVLAFADAGLAIAFVVGFLADWLIGRD